MTVSSVVIPLRLDMLHLRLSDPAVFQYILVIFAINIFPTIKYRKYVIVPHHQQSSHLG